MLLLKLILKALVILWLLPQLGLISFNGGLVWSFIAVFVVWISTFITTLVLLPWLLTSKFFGTLFGAALGGRTSAMLFCFAIDTLLISIALVLASALGSGMVLLGFWPTVGAAAVLGITSSVLSNKPKS